VNEIRTSGNSDMRK